MDRGETATCWFLHKNEEEAAVAVICAYSIHLGTYEGSLKVEIQDCIWQFPTAYALHEYSYEAPSLSNCSSKQARKEGSDLVIRSSKMEVEENSAE
eukprot:scaffold42_cov77-Skeletonema_marinoi.AAC.7